ncbi:SOS response-associated peptidase [Rummeliibacillus sp. JY-2-4R]
MCGRFSLYSSFDELLEEFNIQQAFEESLYEESYNIAPTHNIVAIINDGVKNRMGHLKWGLIPSWAKDAKMASKMINARSETVDVKPSYKKAFEQKRCLIPMSSFFEWKREEKSKTPMLIKMKNASLFAVAGLYDTWHSPTKETIHTCTILTTKPNHLMANIHDRMPVILPKEQQSIWLDRSIRNHQILKSILLPYYEAEMMTYEVSDDVNSPKNNSKELIMKLSK